MGIESIIGAAITAVGANKAAKKASQGSTSKVELDPRMQGILYGDGQRVLRPGVEAKMGIGTEEDYRRMLNNEHVEKFGIDIPTDQASQDWLTQAVRDRMAQGQQVQMNPDSDFMADEGVVGRITGLLDQGQSPGMSSFGSAADSYIGANGLQDMQNMRAAANSLMGGNAYSAPTMGAAQVQAPSQNNLNLSPAYQDMIFGAPGANPYLTGGIQKGINQSTNAFGNYLSDATKAVQDQLSGIRGGAVVNGMMGSSRHGIAEGRALGDFGQGLTRAASQFGQNNTDAAVAARAGAYDTDRNRSLAAMSGLGAQQYGVAGQNAQLAQQAALANQQADMNTQRLNSDRFQAGLAANAGLLDQSYKFGGDADSYELNKVGKVSGLLSPFTGFGATQVNTQPMYSNTGANLLGGAMLGQQLAKGFGAGSAFGSVGSPTSNPGFYDWSSNYSSANYG